MKIRVLDTETTGLEASDHVVEIAAWDLTDGEISYFGGEFVKPPAPIPAIASAIHHIIDADVAGAGDWATVVPRFIDDTLDAYAAHNTRFDGQWLTPAVLHGKPFIDTYRAALRLWPDAPSHSNQALRYWLELKGLDRYTANDTHRAGGDAYVTAHILAHILRQPKVTLEGLIAVSSRPALLPRIKFGKHKGKAWSEAPVDYLQWVAKQADMDEDAKYTAQHWINQRTKESPP